MTAARESRPAGERLPPGPSLPRWIQTLGFLLNGWHFLEHCRRRYGGAVTLRTLFDQRFVMVFDPELVRELFQGPAEQLRAGEANALLGPILGPRSVLVLDGAEHLRHRRIMLGPFHGARLACYERAIRQATDDEIDSWPLRRPFALAPSMQSLTLRVIAGAVLGITEPDRERELARRVRAMVDPVARPQGIVSLFIAPRLGLDRSRRRFEAARAELDELLYAEIVRRRRDGTLAERADALSALLGARDEHGARLSDTEVRDELVTLLLAGHETTATGLAWTLDLLLHDRRVLERARERDPRYLDAVVKEALRLRPVIPGVGRVVRGQPFALGPWLIPDGVEINPSIRIIHGRADLYPDPKRFRPERFLVSEAPDTYTWLPFGGGPRRCLGASFAQLEMRVALGRILERTRLRAVSRRRERAQFRLITLAPRRGVRVLLEQRTPSVEAPATGNRSEIRAATGS